MYLELDNERFYFIILSFLNTYSFLPFSGGVTVFKFYLTIFIHWIAFQIAFITKYCPFNLSVNLFMICHRKCFQVIINFRISLVFIWLTTRLIIFPGKERETLDFSLWLIRTFVRKILLNINKVLLWVR